MTYDKFWLFYLREHSDPTTRIMHFVGTAFAIVCLVLAALLGSWWLLVAAPIAAYGFAWVSHFFVEKNKPATFSHPLWSLGSDFRMLYLWCIGRLEGELEKAEADSGSPAQV